jgi:hypothetical protein
MEMNDSELHYPGSTRRTLNTLRLSFTAMLQIFFSLVFRHILQHTQLLTVYLVLSKKRSTHMRNAENSNATPTAALTLPHALPLLREAS